MNTDPTDEVWSLPEEGRKRRREWILIFLTAIAILVLVWFEIRLFDVSSRLPFVHSIFFFGLVNINIVLVLILLFFIFRNVVKTFVEKKSKILGGSLRAKLVTAFVSFSFIPTALMFGISVGYINSSFDKWFNVKMASVLKNSLEVTNSYYFSATRRNYHFAHEVAKELASGRRSVQKILRESQKIFSLDSVEYYPSLVAERIIAVSEDEAIPEIPIAALEFLQKGIRNRQEASTIHQFGEGNLVRVIVPLKNGGAVVVSSFIPLSLLARMNDVSEAYAEFKDINPLEYPLKSIYLTVLFLITLVILFAATWFGFYLAKQISIPIAKLGWATRRLASGDYTKVDVRTGSDEINSLVESFNSMSDNLATSEQSLRETLTSLDKHTRYIEVVLASVSAGVISVDPSGKITTFNRHAGKLLGVEPDKYLNRNVRELLTLEYFRVISDLLKSMVEYRVESLTRETRVQVQSEVLPLQMTLSILKNEFGEEVGKVLVFDDMTPIVSAQRAAAWSDVARRIAHEIKNPLTPIKLSAERLYRRFADQMTDPVFAECTTMIIKQTEELKNLVNEFNQFARLPQAKTILGSFNRVVEESVAFYRASRPEVNFGLSLDPNLPDFKFDPSQFNRVLVNLLDNAIATQSKEITTETKYDSSLSILQLSVADLGPGIPPQDRNRVFEPNFSTKEHGSGLGLAIVKRIVEDHSGFIRALNNKPRGTRMVIDLPVGEARVVAAVKPSAHKVSDDSF